ncbi:hypothetical protein D3C81_1511050 [compost metagenome]
MKGGQCTLRTQPETWLNVQRPFEVVREPDEWKQLFRNQIITHVSWRLGDNLAGSVVHGGNKIQYRGSPKIALRREGFVGILAVAGDALQVGKLLKGGISGHAEQWPIVKGLGEHQRDASGPVSNVELVH